MKKFIFILIGLIMLSCSNDNIVIDEIDNPSTSELHYQLKHLYVNYDYSDHQIEFNRVDPKKAEYTGYLINSNVKIPFTAIFYRPVGENATINIKTSTGVSIVFFNPTSDIRKEFYHKSHSGITVQTQDFYNKFIYYKYSFKNY